MQQIPDALVSLALVGLLSGVVFFHPDTLGRPAENAVLGKISAIMTDLETELDRQSGQALSSAEFPLSTVLQHGRQTAFLGKPGDAFLAPDLSVDAQGHQKLGGCPVDSTHSVVMRLDHAALTQVPAVWDKSEVKLCLDTNGSKGPNKEGYDVIWLMFSKTNSPHITLLPVQNARETASGL